MTDAPIHLDRHDHHAELVLNRPQRRNALNAAMWTALPDLLDEAGRPVPLPTGPSWAIASLGAGALSLRLALQMVSILRGGPIPRHGIEGAPPAAEEPATGCHGREG